MNYPSIKKYRAVWANVSDVLIARGFTAEEVEVMRKEHFHRQANALEWNGEPKSSADFTIDEFTRCLGLFEAILQPGNLEVQLELLSLPWRALLANGHVAYLLGLCGVESRYQAFEDYLGGICKNSCRVSLTAIGFGHFSTIMSALTRTAKYKSSDKKWPKKDGWVAPPAPPSAALPAAIKRVNLEELDNEADDTGLPPPPAVVLEDQPF